MRSTIVSIILGALCIVPACARKRPVERLTETEGNRWAKSTFESGKSWLGKVTVVNNGSNSAFGFVGMQSDTLLGQFRFTKDHLQFVDVNDVFKTKDGPERVINEWSIEHSDYHQKISGGRVSNAETENQQITWDKKRFFRVNWESAAISEAGSFPFSIDEGCWTKKASRLLDNSQELAEGSINFTLAIDYQVNPNCIDYPQYFRSDFTHTIHYKYSFREDTTEGYKPYIYTGESDPLMKKYGYFNTISPYINSQGRLENTFMMNRWNLSGTHTIYFTKNFPEKYKWIYNDPTTGIIARTNQLFADNKLPIKFEIKENDGSKDFGDIRYSFVHFVEDPDFQAPFGYGPMDAHPRTGEIIATNSVVWVSDLEYLIQRIKDYDGRQGNRGATSSLYRKINDTMQLDSSRWTQTSTFLTVPELANYYRYLLPEFTYGNAGSPFARRGTSQDMFNADERLNKVLDSKPQSLPDLDSLLNESKKTVDRFLVQREQMANSPRAQKFSTVWHLDEGMFAGMEKVLAVVNPEQAIKDILYRVAIHEFGHNLSLRHNFYGTVDASINRATEKDPKKLVTSSVMDYLNLKDEMGLAYDWEPYDKAALIYAYSDGKLDVNRDKIPYLYCTDEHVFNNPLCNQFDIGASPSEVLMSMIENYDEAYWLRNFRYGRAFWYTDNYPSAAFRTMLDAKRFVSLYRMTFREDQVQAELANIPGLNPFVPKFVADSVGADLRQAVKLAASFYAGVITQSSADKPYFDTYEDFNGGLTKLGIAYDKIFAARFLMGDDAFPLNPNTGFGPVSFVPLRDDGLIGTFIDNVLSTTYLNSGEMYSGFDNLQRTYFALNAASNFDFGGGRVAIDLMRIACFRKATFEAAFNLDADSYAATGAPLVSGQISPTYNVNTADPYFVDEPTVRVIRLNGEYYVAGTIKNPYAAGLIAKQDVAGVLNSHRNFYLVTEGRVPECR